MIIDFRAFGMRLRNRREELGLTQDEVAAAAGISSTHLGKIENNKTKMSAKVFISICNALNVTTDYVVIGSDNRVGNDIGKTVLEKLSLCRSEDQKTILEIINIFISRQ